MLIENINLTFGNKSLQNLMRTFDLKCLVKKSTCFQFSNLTCIDLILANKKEHFKNTEVTEVKTSDHHSLIVAALKSQLLKGKAKTKLYSDYSSCNIDLFKEDLDNNNLKNNCITESINLLPNTKKDHFQKLNINDLKNNLENNQAFF